MVGEGGEVEVVFARVVLIIELRVFVEKRAFQIGLEDSILEINLGILVVPNIELQNRLSIK